MPTVIDGKVKTVEIRVTTTGADGSATGNTTSKRIVGQILDVDVIWHGSAPGATSDITVEGATTGVDIYAKSDAVTSVKKTISVFPTDPSSSSGAALTGALIPSNVCIAEPIKVTVAQCNALTDAAIVRVTYRTVRCEVVQVTTTGSAASAAGNASSRAFAGEILGILLDYHASAPATTDITVTGATTGRQLYAKANSVTDVFVAPASFSVDSAGSALSSDITPRAVCVGEAVKVTLAGADALTNCVTAYIFYYPVEAETLAITTTGSAGSASGSATSVRSHGEILGIYIDYHASAPGTTDITIAEAAEDANHTPASVYAKANSVTDVYVIPGRFAVTNADATLTNDVTPERYFYSRRLKASLAQCDALTNAALVTVFTRYGS